MRFTLKLLDVVRLARCRNKWRVSGGRAPNAVNETSTRASPIWKTAQQPALEHLAVRNRGLRA